MLSFFSTSTYFSLGDSWCQQHHDYWSNRGTYLYEGKYYIGKQFCNAWLPTWSFILMHFMLSFFIFVSMYTFDEHLPERGLDAMLGHCVYHGVTALSAVGSIVICMMLYLCFKCRSVHHYLSNAKYMSYHVHEITGFVHRRPNLIVLDKCTISCDFLLRCLIVLDKCTILGSI